MTEPENMTAALGASRSIVASPEEMQRQLQQLRTLLVASLMALLLFGVGVNIYLFRQLITVRKELDGTTAFLNDYQQNKEPILNQFIGRLQAFAQTHADFSPVLNKYNIKSSPAGQSAPGSPLTTNKPGK